MFELEILHVTHGDKKKKYDTTNDADRAKLQVDLQKMIAEGTAIMLDLGDDTLRVLDYDKEKNQLLLQVEKGKVATEDATDKKAVAVPPVSGGCGR